MKSRTFPKPHIPDYLIYDEMKRRRERDAWQPDYLELPLYRPEMPAKPPVEKYEDPSPSRIGDEASSPDDEPPRDRGVMIIDMNDLFEEDDEDEP